MTITKESLTPPFYKTVQVVAAILAVMVVMVVGMVTDNIQDPIITIGLIAIAGVGGYTIPSPLRK